MFRKNMVFSVLLITIMLISVACTPTSSPTPTSTPSPTASLSPTPSPTSTAAYSQYQLEYILLAKYPDYFWNDPDSYPIGREPSQVQAEANAQFPNITANTAEFTAILEHLGWPNKTDYTDAEKLSIYQQHKILTRAVQITLSGNLYQFTIRTGENQGLRIDGTITTSGFITVTSQTTSFNTHPICLTKGTLIATPEGQVPVEQLQPGMTVWSLDGAGNRVAVPIIKTCSTPVPPSFEVLKVTLSDGRSVTASPGHPSAESKPLSSYKAGDNLDGAQIIAIETVPYDSGATFDLLPASASGFYWANGILLGSTLTGQ